MYIVSEINKVEELIGNKGLTAYYAFLKFYFNRLFREYW